jgi:hypothetical protein
MFFEIPICRHLCLFSFLIAISLLVSNFLACFDGSANMLIVFCILLTVLYQILYISCAVNLFPTPLFFFFFLNFGYENFQLYISNLSFFRELLLTVACINWTCMKKSQKNSPTCSTFLIWEIRRIKRIAQTVCC